MKTTGDHTIQGFTLLELLVVVAIIGFMSSVAMIALGVSRANHRDTIRKLDQVTIIRAASQYETDFGFPPTLLQQSVPVSYWNDRNAGIFFRVADLLGARAAYASIGQEPPFQDLGGGGFGSGPGDGCTIDGIVTSGEQCDDMNQTNGDGCSDQCMNESGSGYSCNNNGLCEAINGENIGNCQNDCYSGTSSSQQGGSGAEEDPGGSGGSQCGNGMCEGGETPGNCSGDCQYSSICFSDGEWDLCCLFSGSYCGQGGASPGAGGYYNVCSGDQCAQRYLLQQPAFTCATDDDCRPNADAGGNQTFEGKFVPDDDALFNTLKPYLPEVTKPPGHIKAHQNDPVGTEVILNRYWASSHPDIVKQHRFCVWVAMELAKNNINPYSADITATPTGYLDSRWSVLCVQ